MEQTKNGNHQLDSIKDFIGNIRSDDEQERLKTIAKIPSLILQTLETKDEILNQLLLVIYNLNTDEDNFEVLNLGNRVLVFRHLIRLYTDSIQNHEPDQIDALIGLINHASQASELLIELSNALYHCGQSNLTSSSDNKTTSNSEDTSKQIDEALDLIKEKASENLYSDALLMVYSIMALRQQQHNQKQS